MCMACYQVLLPSAKFQGPGSVNEAVYVAACNTVHSLFHFHFFIFMVLFQLSSCKEVSVCTLSVA